jgi:hypothetical protein
MVACAHVISSDAPVVDRVLGDQALREQLVAQGAQDAVVRLEIPIWPLLDTESVQPLSVTGRHRMRV